jgi:hypothetical protein
MIHFWGDYNSIIEVGCENSSEKYTKLYYDGKGVCHHFGDGWSVGANSGYNPNIIGSGIEIYHYRNLRDSKTFLEKIYNQNKNNLECEKNPDIAKRMEKTVNIISEMIDKGSKINGSCFDAKEHSVFSGTHPSVMMDRINIFNSMVIVDA